MVKLCTALALVGALAGSAQAGFGAHWALNPGNSDQYHIVKATTTLEVPKAPHPQKERLALWPGMNTQDGGLIQSIIVSFADPSRPKPDGCGGHAGQWCAFTYLLKGQSIQQGKYTPASKGDMLDIHYEYEAHSGEYKQTVSRHGNVISKLSKQSGGKALNWYAEVECQAQAKGATPAHTYHDTTITLAKADMSFGSTLDRNHSSNSQLHTPDGGKTWKVSTINIEAYTCTP